ncbi:GyrI-like domain-containing protein [Longitalea luteola]|uniref:GyrI-like domain-containing protein n=1 Tax=Longitalea luteola TaxID=2812563 RepID=UPI001A96F420|nr:GyrI-like domain-containing protein [Longitalea luteola]
MSKLDLTKTYKTYFTAKTTPELVTIEPAQFISLAGKGDPSAPAFAKNIEALYSTAYTIKFMYKAQNSDFVVSKLEGLWWFDENKFKGTSIETAPTGIPRSEWEYRLLIRMPAFVTAEDIDTAKEKVKTKKDLPLVDQVSFFTMAEGKCIQILHVGPFSTEPETLKRIAEFSAANKLAKNGLHHEIYLSDFRKTAPEKLKTILREPVK